MIRPIRSVVAVTGLLFFSVTAPRAEVTFDFESGGVWAGNADVRIPNPGGTPFSLTNDLGADDPRAFIRGRVTWSINERHDVSLLFAPLEMDFNGSFSRPVNFAGSLFQPGVPVDGTFRFDSYRLTYRYNFVRTENVTFGMGLTGKIRDAEVRLTQRGRTAFDDNTGFVPLINYQLLWRFAPQFSLWSEGDALGASQGYAIDASAALQWHATENLALRVGYRILDGGADNDSVYTMATFHYATVGVSVRF
jgi:hypothetical protein